MKIHLHCFNSEHGRFWAALIRRLHPHSVSTKDQREFKHYVHTSVLTTLKKIARFPKYNNCWSGVNLIEVSAVSPIPKIAIVNFWQNWVDCELFCDKKACRDWLVTGCFWGYEAKLRFVATLATGGRVKFLPVVNNFPENNVFSYILYEHCDFFSELVEILQVQSNRKGP